MSDVSGRKKELLASAARTATAVGSSVSLPSDAKGIGILLVVTADSGTGTFEAKLETSFDGGSTWMDVTTATSGAITAVGVTAKFASIPCGPHVRCTLTESGTAVQTQQVFVIYT